MVNGNQFGAKKTLSHGVAQGKTELYLASLAKGI